jgi:D-aminoacyl-tRNA deacylase
MRAVIQRVSSASVHIGGNEHARIQHGLVVLLGVAVGDQVEDAEWLCGKIARLRVFADADGVMNLDINEVNGAILLISQFTLHALTAKGNRPSYIKAARPEEAVPLYLRTRQMLTDLTHGRVKTGEFGADMQVSLVNDGPVTIIIDSKARE